MARVQPRSYQALQSSWFRPLSHLCGYPSRHARSLARRFGRMVAPRRDGGHFPGTNLLPGWLIGFSLMAAGMLTVAWALWRIPEEVRGALEAVPIEVDAANQRAPSPPDKGRSPSLPPAFAWSADRSWCFARDVDSHWARIGAEQACGGRLRHRRLAADQPSYSFSPVSSSSDGGRVSASWVRLACTASYQRRWFSVPVQFVEFAA